MCHSRLHKKLVRVLLGFRVLLGVRDSVGGPRTFQNMIGLHFCYWCIVVLWQGLCLSVALRSTWWKHLYVFTVIQCAFFMRVCFFEGKIFFLGRVQWIHFTTARAVYVQSRTVSLLPGPGRVGPSKSVGNHVAGMPVKGNQIGPYIIQTVRDEGGCIGHANDNCRIGPHSKFPHLSDSVLHRIAKEVVTRKKSSVALVADGKRLCARSWLSRHPQKIEITRSSGGSSHHSKSFFFSKSRFLINFSTVVVVKHTHVVGSKRLTHIHSHRDQNSLSLSTESTYLLVPIPWICLRTAPRVRRTPHTTRSPGTVGKEKKKERNLDRIFS